MKRHVNRVLVLLLLLLAVVGGVWFGRPANGQTSDAAQIVDQFYPQTLIQDAEELDAPFRRRSCFQVYDTFPAGEPRTIIAGYSNGPADGAAIRVIRGQDGGPYGVVFEPTSLNLWGFDCTVQLVDVDGDSRNEVKVSFPGGMRGSTTDWLFRWDGVQLINLSPGARDTVTGEFDSKLSNSEFLDLYHDGTLQVVTRAGFLGFGSDVEPADKVFRLTPAGYQLDKPVIFVARFEREKGEPVTDTIHFPLVTGSSGPYVLRLSNGGSGGQHRVSSARIVLNGVEVLSPQNFSQQVEFLTIPVSLVRHNTIEVTLAGTPLGEIIVTIEDTSAVPPASQ